MTPSAPTLQRSPAITPQPGGSASSAPKDLIYSSALAAISSCQSGVAAASLAGRITAVTAPSAEQTLHDKVAALLTGVQQNGLALKDASPELQNNPQIVLAAVQQNGLALQFASRELQNNPDIVLAAVQKRGRALAHASPELRNNPDIVLAALQGNGIALEHASPQLKNNPDIVLAAVQQNSYALAYAGDDLKNNFDIVLAAVQENGHTLRYASEDLKNNPDIVLAAVQKNGGALEHASPELRNNPDIVLAAVQKYWSAFEHASPELQNDPVFLLTAAENNGLVLEHIRADLITLSIACAAVAQTPDAIRWVPEVYIRDASSNKDHPSFFALLDPKDKTLVRATRAIEFNPLLLGAIPAEVQINLDEGFVVLAIKRKPKALNRMKPACITPLMVNGLVLNSDGSYNTCEQDIIDRNLDRENALRKVAQLVIDKEISEAVATLFIYALAKYFNDDKKFIIYAITNYGVSLELASDRLKEDADVVDAAREKDLSLTAYSTSILRSGMFAIMSDLFD
jgi:histidinol phosphatase-like PHP family hydrolase